MTRKHEVRETKEPMQNRQKRKKKQEMEPTEKETERHFPAQSFPFELALVNQLRAAITPICQHAKVHACPE